MMPRTPARERDSNSFLAMGERRRVRFTARAAAVAFLGLAIARGLALSGELDYDGSPWPKLPGELASVVGLAADDIKIHGLVNEDPESVLSAIGVRPGASLIGFNATVARRILENLDWVKSAKVQRLFPNQLEITVVERQPFAVWQRDSHYFVIDINGVAMSGIPGSVLVKLPLVTGEGAQTTAAELFNELEATPGLKSQVRAAARVGDRRWTLYLDSGVTVLLPEGDPAAALATLEKLDSEQQLLSRGISSVDLRIPGRITVAAAVLPVGDAAAGKVANK
jgi:cell division protein FtsQ